MKKRTLTAFAAFALLLSLLGGCGAPSSEPAPAGDGNDDTVHVLATTYPVYLLTTALTDGIDGAEVTLLVNSQTSCLHDYTLTVPDMKAIEAADVIVMNGAGMEEFMSDALARSEAAVIDSSAQVELLTMGAHVHDHDGNEVAAEGEVPDPHIWMDPDNASKMLEAIADGLEKADPIFAPVTGDPLTAAQTRLTEGKAEMEQTLSALPADRRNLVTFHDGFHYFAHAFDLNLLKSIEEEEGSEASAADIKEIVDLVNEYQLPAIFTEKKGSTATADAISRETGCAVAQLDMMMSGEGFGIQGYLDVLSANVNAIAEALK